MNYWKPRLDRAMLYGLLIFAGVVIVMVAFGSNGTGLGLIYVVAFLAAVGGYFLPALLAWSRRVPNSGSVLVINLFLGWTLVGWVVALAMAARTVPQQTVA
jgi:hypothetical protein